MRRHCRGGALLLCSAIASLVTLSCASAPPEPPPPKVREVVTWEILPADGYQDEKSYVTLEYAPPETLRASAAELPEGQPAAPAGGRLTVHLGYRNLGDANTAWFRFEAAEGARVLVRFDGEQGVPNVKGLDGYWWNDVQLDLPEPVVAEARVAVHNRKYAVDYIFSLRRAVDLQVRPAPR